MAAAAALRMVVAGTWKAGRFACGCVYKRILSLCHSADKCSGIPVKPCFGGRTAAKPAFSAAAGILLPVPGLLATTLSCGVRAVRAYFMARKRRLTAAADSAGQTCLPTNDMRAAGFCWRRGVPLPAGFLRLFFGRSVLVLRGRSRLFTVHLPASYGGTGFFYAFKRWHVAGF